MTLIEDDERSKITLEGVKEIRDNSYRIDVPFTISLNGIELRAGITFVLI